MNTITPEMHKQLVAQHQLWLQNPLTQMVVTTIKNRLKKYDDTLVEGIRIQSDKEAEDKLRVAISTCKAILQIVSDSEKFIEHSTKQLPTDK